MRCCCCIQIDIIRIPIGPQEPMPADIETETPPTNTDVERV